MNITNEDRHIFGVYCGNKTGQIVFVTGGYVLITFNADDSAGGKGFLIVFNEVNLGEYTPNEVRHVTLDA